MNKVLVELLEEVEEYAQMAKDNDPALVAEVLRSYATLVDELVAA